MTHAFGSDENEIQEETNQALDELKTIFDFEAEVVQDNGYFFKVKSINNKKLEEFFHHYQKDENFHYIYFGTEFIDQFLSDFYPKELVDPLSKLQPKIFKILYNGITYERIGTELHITGESGCAGYISKWPATMVITTEFVKDNGRHTKPTLLKIKGPMKYSAFPLFDCQELLDLTESDIEQYYARTNTQTLPRAIHFASHRIFFPFLYLELFRENKPQYNDNSKYVTFTTNLSGDEMNHYYETTYKQDPNYFVDDDLLGILNFCCRC